MYFVGEDDEFVIDVLGPEELDQAGGLGEIHVAVVVAVDQQDRRGPFFDGGNGGGLEGDVVGIEGAAAEVDAGDIDPGRKDIGITRQAHGGEDAAVGQAPEADAFGIDIGVGLEVFAGGLNVLVFGGTAGTAVGGAAKFATVADAAAVVDGHDNIALVAEVLVDGIGHVVEIHIVIAEQHLPLGSAVGENQGGAFFAASEVLGQENLVMEFQAVGGAEHYVFGNDLIFQRKGRGDFGCDNLGVAAFGIDQGDRKLPLGVGIDNGDFIAGRQRRR